MECDIDNTARFYTSTDPVTVASASLSIYEMCSCVVGVMDWDPAAEDCAMDCPSMGNTTGTNLSPTECECNPSYFWNSEIGCLSCANLS